MLKTAYFTLLFSLFISCVFTALVFAPYSHSESVGKDVRKDVLCGDTFITQQYATGHKQQLVKGLPPFFCQFLYLVYGTIITFSIMSIFTTNLHSNEDYFFYGFYGLVFAGLTISFALTIFVGNLTGTLSPTFINSCKPSISVFELCKEAVPGVKTYVKLNCTSSPIEWNNLSTSASFRPLLITLLSYSMNVLCIWSMMLRQPSSHEGKWRLYGLRLFVILLTITFMIGIGSTAYFQLEASWMDIITGFLLGFVVAAVIMGIMPKLLPPEWCKPSEPVLPPNAKDLFEKKSDETTSTFSSIGKKLKIQ